MVKGLRHVGLVIRDVERALGFYRDVLGFVVEKDSWETGPFVEVVLGLAAVKVRTIKMKLSQGTLLELLYFESHPSSSAEQKIQRQGFSHIALTVQDVDALHRNLSKQGIVFICEPKVSADGKAKAAFCRDPEGNFLELVQELS